MAPTYCGDAPRQPREDDHSPEAWTTRQTILGGHIASIYATLQAGPAAREGDPPPNRKLGKALPQAARAAADIMDLAPEVFSSAAFSAASLRADEERLRGMGAGLAAMENVVDNLRTEITWSEGTLADKVALVITTTQAVLGNPLTPEATKTKLESAAQPLFTLLAERNTAKASRRQATRMKNEKDAAAEAEKTRLNLTVKHMAGEPIVPEDVMAAQTLAARKSTRRDARRRPRSSG